MNVSFTTQRTFNLDGEQTGRVFTVCRVCGAPFTGDDTVILAGHAVSHNPDRHARAAWYQQMLREAWDATDDDTRYSITDAGCEQVDQQRLATGAENLAGVRAAMNALCPARNGGG